MANPSAAARAAGLRLGTDAERPGDSELWAAELERCPEFAAAYQAADDDFFALMAALEPGARH
jgi:hypothetical protein